MAAATNLPAYRYTRGALPVGGNPYLWCRNLLANRLYACPVVYCEPYVMNNEAVAARIQAGDFDGTRLILGQEMTSIFREYAQSVADGLRQHFSQR
jgi:hypothetical protein